METPAAVPETTQPGICPEHAQAAKWTCAHCGRPLCPACKPVAFDYKVFHVACLELAQQKKEKRPARMMASDMPTVGIKIIAWLLLISAVFWFGVALLLAGLTLFSRHYAPFMTWMSDPVPYLDDVPGGRIVVAWVSGLAALGAGVQALLGVGLLNCAPAARRTLLIFAWLEIAVAGIGWLAVWYNHEGFWDIPVIAVLLVIYLSRQDVKKQFQPVKVK